MVGSLAAEEFWGDWVGKSQDASGKMFVKYWLSSGSCQLENMMHLAAGNTLAVPAMKVSE